MENAMACANPISTDGPAGPIFVRCKQCLPCRIYKQSSLTLRCLLENQSSSSGQFITLTYAQAPEVGSYGDFQKFLKRLRQWNVRKGNSDPLRYLACGEYGSKSGRFHYHALVWNGLVPTQEDWDTQLWGNGFVYIGTVTPASVRYTARYTLKFNEKGQEAVNGWSKSPPLGAFTMRALGEQARRSGLIMRTPPATLGLDGKTYPVDNAMQIEFCTTYNPELIVRDARGTRKLAKSSAAAAHLDYVTTLRLGDPIAAQRNAQNEKATFYETARLSSERL